MWRHWKLIINCVRLLCRCFIAAKPTEFFVLSNIIWKHSGALNYLNLKFLFLKRIFSLLIRRSVCVSVFSSLAWCSIFETKIKFVLLFCGDPKKNQMNNSEKPDEIVRYCCFCVISNPTKHKFQFGYLRTWIVPKKNVREISGVLCLYFSQKKNFPHTYSTKFSTETVLFTVFCLNNAHC